ncbi:non-ribosomal peptide synthetase [Actinokineospora sp.]|uniref:non-ribosomal peptide synthetase n=1 Tax=Actinokineospora sp. TaxID=1872133 RepID=UPI004037C7BF
MTDEARDRLFALLAARRGLDGAGAGIPRREPDADVPLLPGQRQLWILDQLGVQHGVYTMAQSWRLVGELDLAGLRHSLAVLVDRHEALRTCFPDIGGEPVQRIASRGVELPLSIVEGLDALGAELDRPFDLATAPLARAVLVRVSEREHLFALSVHHIACDGPSLSILVGELGECYRAWRDERMPALAEPRVAFGDYAAWRHEQSTPDAMAEHRRYWTARLTDAPDLLELPTDRPRPPTQSFRGDSHPFALSAAVSQAVAEFCARTGSTPFPVLLTAFAIVLARHSRAEDIVVGVPMRDESVPGIGQCVGMLVNTVALRTTLTADSTVREVLDHVQREAVNALEHQGFPWDQVAGLVRPTRDLSHNPVFQTMFVLNPEGAEVELPGLRVEPLIPPTTTARFDLTLALTQSGGIFLGQLDFATDLFDATTIARFAVHLGQAVAAVVADPNARVTDIELLTDAEWARVRSGGHDTEPAAPDTATPVHELIAAQAARTPDAPAVLADGEDLSYADLTVRAHRLAWHLHRRGVRPETVVALGLSASPAAMVGLLGILSAGGAYLPLDPTHPADRLAVLLADARPPVLVTTSAHLPAFAAFGGEVVLLDGDLPDCPAGPPPVEVGPSDLAYLIYTSGSTGTPKGVLVEHGTLAALTRAFVTEHGFGPGERVLMVPPLSFDASVGDVFPALVAGAALLPCADPAALSGHDLLRLCRERRITMVDTASALWQKWTDDLAGTVAPTDSPLTTMMVGGESVPLATVRAWAERTGCRVRLFNHYGPTEATVCATTYQTVDGSELGQAAHLPIGAPLPHTRVYIVDDRLRPVPLGVPGELCIGGATLARGYLGRDDATADRFVPDPYSAVPGARMYRTGDLARWRSDGRIDFLGRVDRQVKIRGHRVEPAEIEAACRRHPGIRDALVIARDGSSTVDRRLVGYLIPVADAGPTPAELRTFLRAALPEYLVPGAFVLLESFPLTSNGKVDHTALPEPVETTAIHVEPSTDVERRMAAVWADLLGRDRVGATDDFFVLGGHSLLAATLVTRVRAEFGVDLPLRGVFEASVLADFAALVETGSVAAARLDLWTEAVLPADIRLPDGTGPDDVARAVRKAAAPDAVLLTGATGFLGSYLLADTLRHTDARVLCLVRAGTETGAAGRIERTLRGYGLWRDEDATRIVPVPGDLAAPRFGLSPERFAAMAAEVDLILHCAGLVNFALSYSDLKRANVGGTVEALRLACLSRVIPVQMVSTLGVFPLDRTGVVTERHAPDEPDGLDRGYEQSKWVADTLGRAARALGLPVTIHRPARVTGDSRTGIGPAEDLFGRELRTVALLGLMADVADEEDMAPVDEIAAAIGRLSRTPACHGGDFHFHNGQTIGTHAIAAALRAYGYPVRMLPYVDFYAELVARAAESADTALATIAAVAEPTPSSRRRIFDCRATETAAGLRFPAAADLLDRYLDHYVRSGHLPAPEQAGVRR